MLGFHSYSWNSVVEPAGAGDMLAPVSTPPKGYLKPAVKSPYFCPVLVLRVTTLKQD